jgi:DNA-directed RNA polymerase subunit RPC12/RpoP
MTLVYDVTMIQRFNKIMALPSEVISLNGKIVGLAVPNWIQYAKENSLPMWGDLQEFPYWFFQKQCGCSRHSVRRGVLELEKLLMLVTDCRSEKQENGGIKKKVYARVTSRYWNVLPNVPKGEERNRGRGQRNYVCHSCGGTNIEHIKIDVYTCKDCSYEDRVSKIERIK